MLLKKDLEPTDFADADCRVTPWVTFDSTTGRDSYRVWLCKCGRGYWFQRHEWTRKDRNSTFLDEWIFTGYSPYRTWPGHFSTAPEGYTDDR